MRRINVLVIGPCDPNGGEYTFVSPPLGVWRLAGTLRAAGHIVEVFDPNLDSGRRAVDLTELLRDRRWDVIGFSTTGMTLPHDLALAHLARRHSEAVLVAGGMEATFRPELLLTLAPFNLVVLGEGEKPLLALAQQLGSGLGLAGIPGTALVGPNGALVRIPQPALTRDELARAVFQIPYGDMPYRRYWARLEDAYRVHSLPTKADREARLSEIRSVRLPTLNYCPMGCTFCSSTNFLHSAQSSTAKISRLDADECLAMMSKICGTYPDVRTVLFQDDIFAFTKDDRIVPLCEGIVAARRRGDIPHDLQFISTNRIDSMTPERLRWMKAAGFRVLGFGVESFSPSVLAEFNKSRIVPYIDPILSEAISLGMTPFLDLILASPRSKLSDIATTLRVAYRWIQAGCEVGMYPYVIPFSGAPMASDPAHGPHTIFERCLIEGTDVSWDRATKILPHDPLVRDTILEIEDTFGRLLDLFTGFASHAPSRVRSLLWILAGCTTLDARHGLPPANGVAETLQRSGSLCPGDAKRLVPLLRAATSRQAIA